MKQKEKRLMIALVFTLLLFNGCEKIVYVHTDCPKVPTYDVNSSDLDIDYEVYQK